jgi:hypothetical protein
MKEFKLTAWPELPAPYHRTVYRRMLSDMSHRYMSVQQLVLASGASRLDVRLFLQMLGERGLLREREGEPDSIFDRCARSATVPTRGHRLEVPRTTSSGPRMETRCGGRLHGRAIRSRFLA